MECSQTTNHRDGRAKCCKSAKDEDDEQEEVERTKGTVDGLAKARRLLLGLSWDRHVARAEDAVEEDEGEERVRDVEQERCLDVGAWWTSRWCVSVM
jgi:hypothetical protein